MTRRHALLMLACCLVPAAGIAALVVFRVPVNTALWLVFALACPVIHVLGMRSMGHGGGHHQPALPSARPDSGSPAPTLLRPVVGQGERSD